MEPRIRGTCWDVVWHKQLPRKILPVLTLEREYFYLSGYFFLCAVFHPPLNLPDRWTQVSWIYLLILRQEWQMASHRKAPEGVPFWVIWICEPKFSFGTINKWAVNWFVCMDGDPSLLPSSLPPSPSGIWQVIGTAVMIQGIWWKPQRGGGRESSQARSRWKSSAL